MATQRWVICWPAMVTILLLGVPARCGEVLYNGIELPDDWPPTRTLEDLRAGKPMEVPYLKNPPAVIRIDVGRQLFVDDFLIESTTLQRVFHKPAPHEGNPVLRPNKRWEVAFKPNSAMCFSRGYVAGGGPGLTGPTDTEGIAAYRAAGELE